MGRPRLGGSGPPARRLRDRRFRSRAASLDVDSLAAYRPLASRARRLARQAFEHVL